MVFKSDAADVTDWIQSRLNGRRLVLTKEGSVVLKGRDGRVEFPTGELRDLFGRKFREGTNDGLRATLAAELGDASWERATIGQIADALAKDRANYVAWVERRKAVRRGERPPTDEERHYMEQAEEEEAFRRREFEIGGEFYRGEELLGFDEARDAAFAEDAQVAAEIEAANAEGRFKRVPMTELAKSKVGEWAEGVTADGVKVAVGRRIADGVKSGAYRVKRDGDAKRMAAAAMRFYRRFSRKTVMLSDGRCVYFVPDARAKWRGFDNEEAWAEYAIHAVTSSGRKLSDGRFERLYNPSKAADIWRIENVLKAEKCALDTRRGGENDIAFYGKGTNGKPIRIITKFDEKGNIYADLTEVTVVNTREEKVPPLKPLAEVVSQAHGRGALLADGGDTISNPAAGGQGGVTRFKVGGLYTGSAADYERPSLHAVGTGEGAQVYGWGLYASNVRGIAESYATNVAFAHGRKTPLFLNMIKDNGTTRNGVAITPESVKAKREEYQDKNEYWADLIAAENDNPKQAREEAKRYGGEIEKYFNDHFNEYEFAYGDYGREYLYEQTWFTDRPEGDESHLLNWYEPISAEQKGLLEKAIREQFRTEDFHGQEMAMPEGLTDASEGVSLDLLLGKGAKSSGENVYSAIKRLLGSPRAASEWLAAHGIDGVKYPAQAYVNAKNKDGRKGWNYVTFRDDNIRVDHKWADGEMRYRRGGVSGSVFRYEPGANAGGEAIGDVERKAAALRPWTRAGSPCAEAKPIAFDAADLMRFWRRLAAGGKIRVAAGDRVPGRKDAVGLNAGGKEITSRPTGGAKSSRGRPDRKRIRRRG